MRDGPNGNGQWQDAHVMQRVYQSLVRRNVEIGNHATTRLELLLNRSLPLGGPQAEVQGLAAWRFRVSGDDGAVAR